MLVDEWNETRALTRISASIHVERPGQKTILIGKQGEVLKRIGTAARTEIEKMTRTKSISLAVCEGEEKLAGRSCIP